MVRTGRGRRGQVDRLRTGPPGGDPADSVRAHLRVACRDRGVFRAVVAQRRSCRGTVALVADHDAQRKGSAWGRTVVVHRRRLHHQVGTSGLVVRWRRATRENDDAVARCAQVDMAVVGAHREALRSVEVW